MRLIFIIFIFGVAVSANAAPRKCVVFYMPLNIDTYVPVSMESIEKGADYKLQMNWGDFKNLFGQILDSNRRKEVDPKGVNVRVKINCVGAELGPLFFDKNKAIFTATHFYEVPAEVTNSVLDAIMKKSRNVKRRLSGNPVRKSNK